MKTSITLTFKEPYSVDAKLTGGARRRGLLSWLLRWRDARGEGRPCLHTLLFQCIRAEGALQSPGEGVSPLPSMPKMSAASENLHRAGAANAGAQARVGSPSLQPPEGGRRGHVSSHPPPPTPSAQRRSAFGRHRAPGF